MPKALTCAEKKKGPAGDVVGNGCAREGQKRAQVSSHPAPKLVRGKLVPRFHLRDDSHVMLRGVKIAVGANRASTFPYARGARGSNPLRSPMCRSASGWPTTGYIANGVPGSGDVIVYVCAYNILQMNALQ